MRSKLLVTLLGLSIAALALTQTAPLVSMEGKLHAVDVERRIMNVMGLPVYVPDTVYVKTPTGGMGLKYLLGANLPGRSVKGFLNGVVLVKGEYVNGQMVARSILATPEECVLAAPLRWTNGAFTIQGKPLQLVTDWRMPGHAVNAGGLPIDLTTAPEGADALASGYAGEDGVFYATTLECDSAQIPAGTVATAIVTSRLTGADSIDVRGGTTLRAGAVKLYNGDTKALMATAPIVDTGSYGKYAFRVNRISQIPTRVVVISPDGSRASKSVD